MPLEQISAALTSLKTATDIGKIIQNSIRAYNEAELRMQFLELMTALTDARTELARVSEVLITKDEEIRDLAEKLKLKGEVYPDQGVYFRRLDDGSSDGPFCTRCWDVNRKLVRLRAGYQGCMCTECKVSFEYIIP